MKTNRLISLLLCLCMVFALFTGFAESASAADDYITYTIKNGDNLYTLVGKMGMNYGTVKYVIMALNGFTNENQLSQLQPGQTILLPTSNQAAASLASKALTSTAATTTVAVATTATGTTTGTAASTASASAATSSTSSYQGFTPAYYLVAHTVQKGETLTSICKALGTNYYDYTSVVLGVNSMANANSLKVGQSVWVPAKTGSAGGTIAVVAYSVKPGDSISSICNDFDTSYANYKAVVKAVNPKIKDVEKLNVGQTVYIPVYTTWNNAVAGNASTATGNAGSPTTSVATGYAIGFTVPAEKAYGDPFAIVGTQANATRAAAGSTVIIRPNAYSGYAVKSIKVVRTDSNQSLQLNDYAFTMPNSNVQVTVTYDKGNTITKKATAHGTYDTVVYGAIGSTAFYGDEVEILAYPDDGYELSDKKGDIVVKTASGGSVTPTYNTAKGTWTFKMPNEAVTVSVKFILSSSIALKFNTDVAFHGYGAVQFYVNGQQVTKANKGDEVTVMIIPADGWMISTSKMLNPDFVTEANGNIKKRSDGVEDITKVNNYTYRFKISDPLPTSGKKEIVVKVDFTEKIPYALTRENLSGKATYGTVTFTVTDASTGTVRRNTDWAYPGDKVEIVPFALSDGKWIDGTYYTFTYKYDADGSAANGSGLGHGGTNEYTTLPMTGAAFPNALWTKPGFEFIMPDAIVNVDARFFAPTDAQIKAAGAASFPVAIADNDHGTVEILDASGKKINQVVPNSTVTVRVTAEKNYRIQRQVNAGVTEYGLYYNDGGINDEYSTLIQATNPINASKSISYYYLTSKTKLSEVVSGSVTESINSNGNVVTEFKIKLSSNIIQGMVITALYEPYYDNYSVNKNIVELYTRSRVIVDGTTTDYEMGSSAHSPALVTPLNEASSLSNIQMYVNGVVVKDGTEVPVGTIVGFMFTVKDGYKLKNVWKLSNVGNNEELVSSDGVYWYQVDASDANASSSIPRITFMVETEQIAATTYSILYSNDQTYPDPEYEVTNLTTSSTTPATPLNCAGNGEITGNKAGDQIQIFIPYSKDPTTRTLARVTVDGANLTMGDLQDNGSSGWTYTFVMPDHDVKTQVVYKDLELMDP